MSLGALTAVGLRDKLRRHTGGRGSGVACRGRHRTNAARWALPIPDPSLFLLRDFIAKAISLHFLRVPKTLVRSMIRQALSHLSEFGLLKSKS